MDVIAISNFRADLPNLINEVGENLKRLIITVYGKYILGAESIVCRKTSIFCIEIHKSLEGRIDIIFLLLSLVIIAASMAGTFICYPKRDLHI